MSSTVEIVIPEIYKTLFDPRYRIKVYEGGRYGLKSHSIARAMLIKARQSKRRILNAREVQKSMKDSVHKLYKDLIEQYGLDDFVVNDTEIYNKITGSEFLFYGLKSANITDLTKIKSLEGITDTWVEEAQSVSEDSLDILKNTVCRTLDYEIIFSLNRYSKNDPVFARYCKMKRPHVLHQKVLYTDFEDFFKKQGLEQLYQQIIREAEDDKLLNPDKYVHMWLGEPKINKEGAVYKFISRYHVEEGLKERVLKENPQQRILRGWDFGLHPAVKFYAVTPFGLRTLREIVPDNKPTLSQLITQVQYVSNTEFPERSFDDLCDIAGRQTSHQTGQTSIDILNAAGIYPEYEMVPIEDGIIQVQNLLDRPEGMLVDASCTATIEAYEGGYYRKEDKTGLGKEMPPEQVHPYEDVMDIDRYTVWRYFKPESLTQKQQRNDIYKQAMNCYTQF